MSDEHRKPNMLPRQFFETDSLYTVIKFQKPELSVWFPSINLHCPNCNMTQTFNPSSNHIPFFSIRGGNFVGDGSINFIYNCAACGFPWSFLITYYPEDSMPVVTKAGQYPEVDIGVPTEIRNSLGDWIQLYKRGKTCEKHSFGIGAFAYYRRLVEGLIDNLIDDIEKTIPEEEKKDYRIALAKVKKSKRATDKIETVKEFLPTTLRPGGVNPLQVLYDLLSIGIHRLTETECLEYAQETRQLIDYLLVEIPKTQIASSQFKSILKRLKDKIEGEE